MASYPIFLDMTGRAALVVGLGSVGRRKAGGLLAAGARVIGVDPSAGDAPVPAGIEVRAEPYRAEHLLGVELVFAAATAGVNRQVVADAKKAGVWVTSASDPDDGDFALPAVWRQGPLVLAISTGGSSPVLAAALRDRAAVALGPASAGLAALLAELRPLALARVGDSETRRRLLADWGDPRRLGLWESEGAEAVRRDLLRTLEDLDRG